MLASGTIPPKVIAVCTSALMGPKELPWSSELSLSGSDRQERPKEWQKYPWWKSCPGGKPILHTCIQQDRDFARVSAELFQWHAVIFQISVPCCRTGKAAAALTLCKATEPDWNRCPSGWDLQCLRGGHITPALAGQENEQAARQQPPWTLQLAGSDASVR